MTPREDITGAILAGGSSSRMGRDKALLGYRGATFLEHAAAALRTVARRVIVVADDADAYAFLGAPVYPDLVKNSGPLAGIHSALSHSPTGATLIMSCDLPLVSPAELRAIVVAFEGDVTIPYARGNFQPLCGVYGKRFLPVAHEYLRSGNFRVLDALADPRVRLHLLAMEERRGAFASVNTPEEYRRLRSAGAPLTIPGGG